MNYKLKFFMNKSRAICKKYLILQRKGKFGVIDKDGNVVYDFKYLSITSNNDFLITNDGLLSQIFDARNETEVFKNVILRKTELENFFLANQNCKNKIINFATGEFYPTAFEEVQLIKPDVFLVKKDDKYGLLSTDFTKSLPCEYDSITYDGERYFYVNKNDKKTLYKTGIVSPNFEVLLPCKYTSKVTYDESKIFRKLEARIKAKDAGRDRRE